MIIILEPKKDAYVTNLKTRDNDGAKANLGKAATIDLFKLYNENKNSHSWAAFSFSGQVSDGETLSLIDSKGVTKVFEFDTSSNGVIAGNIAVTGSNGSNEAIQLSNAINAVNDFAISATKTLDNKIILKQDNPGDSGDTQITLSSNIGMTHLGDSTKNKFARIDYSVGLIKFDLEDFKSKWITLSDNQLQGSFSSLEAEIVLKDVTTGIAKPKDYNLELFSLLKNFKEGTGKDAIHFSDKDVVSFKNLSSEETWEVESIVSTSDAVDITTSSSIKVEKGDEDLKFNVTQYVKDELVKANITDKGFIIKFIESDLYNNKSYFAKRLGTRHLMNKKLRPELRIKIDDSSSHIPTNSFNKQRLLNVNESFYLFNRVNGSLSSFIKPDNTATLNFKVTNKDKTTDLATGTVQASNITNFRGDVLTGIHKANVEVDRFNDNITSLVKSNKLEANYIWYWTWGDPVNTKNILEKRVDFIVSETHNNFDSENLISTVKVDENFIDGNDSVSSIKVYFTDTKKEFNAVKVPYELPSENVGDVHYSVIDVEDQKVIIDYDTLGTKLFYDGEKYVFDFYAPEKMKNTRINFKFRYKDLFTNSDKYIYNEKYSVRIV